MPGGRKIDEGAPQHLRIENVIQAVGGKFLFGGVEHDAANWVDDPDAETARVTTLTNETTLKKAGEDSLKMAVNAGAGTGIAGRVFGADTWILYRFMAGWWRRSGIGTQSIRIIDSAGEWDEFNLPAAAANTWVRFRTDILGTPDASSAGVLDLENIVEIHVRGLTAGESHYLDGLMIYPEAGLQELLAVIGQDNADNEVSTALVTANEDGSSLERLEKLKDDIAAVPTIAEMGILTGTVGATRTSSSQFETSLTESQAIHGGGILVFTSGANIGEARMVVDIATGPPAELKVQPAFSNVPATSDTFIIVQRAHALYLAAYHSLATLATARAFFDDSLVDQVYIAAGQRFRDFVAKTGGTAVAAGKSLVDALGATGSAYLASGLAARIGAPVGASISADVAAVKAAVDVVDDLLDTEIANLTTKVNTLHDTRIPGVIQPQTGDSFARLGAPAGASVSADIAAIQADTNDIQASMGKGVTSSTSTGAGTSTTLVDTARTEADDYWNGALLVMTEGADIGQAREIIDFDAASDTITVAPPFLSATGTGNDYIIVASHRVISELSKQAIATVFGAPVTDSLVDQLYIAAAEQLRKFIATTGGTAVPATSSLYDLFESKSPAVLNTITLPDVIGTNADLFDGGAAIDTQTPASFAARWDTTARAKVHIELDLVNLAGGDTVILEILKRVDASNFRVAVQTTYTGDQTPVEVVNLEVELDTNCPIQGRIRQTAGVARVVPVRFWAVGQNGAA